MVKFCNISKGFRDIFIAKFSKGHNFIMYMELQFLFRAHHLMMLYIFTKFHENISTLFS